MDMEETKSNKRENNKGKNEKSRNRQFDGQKNRNKFAKNNETFLNHPNSSKSDSMIRKKVDPETAKYFTEITSLLESKTIDLEERQAISTNALDETRGKELESATDPIISRTLQTLLESCDLDQLCGFLRGCANSFPIIATDKFGSHVSETAIKSLFKHLHDESSISYIEDTLNMICKIVVKDAMNVMQCRYGSHVLRSLLCLTKGVPLERLEEFHVTKRSDVLAARVNLNPEPNKSFEFEYGFKSVFKSLVKGMMDSVRNEIVMLRVDQFSSFVFQTMLRLSIGDEEELDYLISILLRLEENLSGSETKQEIMGLLDETASSHLLEMIIEVSPDKLFDKLLNEVLIGSLFNISSHQWGNFVVQSLISSIRTKDQMTIVWEELGQKTKELLQKGKPGILASILVSCFKLQTNRRECVEALAEAVRVDNDESNGNIVEHILYLDSFLMDTSSWKWPSCERMHVLGCLMLQTIFKYPKQYVKSYVESLLSIQDEHIFQICKDSGGARVLESFLDSDTTSKLKLRLIAKIKGHYGELAMNASSSYTVEKCFSASNISLKEAICEELLNIRSNLSKTRHGFHLLRKLDIDGFARQPEQWKTSQKSKENAYKEFQAVFGEPSEKKLKIDEQNNNDQNKKQKINKIPIKQDGNHNNEMNNNVHKKDEIEKPKFGKRPFENKSTSFLRNSINNAPFVRQSGKKESSVNELAQLAGKSELSAGDVRKLFNASMNNDKGHQKVPFVNKRKR